MTRHVVILGIDGSGKSQLVRTLPLLVAAELEMSCGMCGDGYAVLKPKEDVVQFGFHPAELPVCARLATRLKRSAKRLAHGRRRYPLVKLLQLIMQDRAARALARKHQLDVMVADGNTELCVRGRGANYLAPASLGRRSRWMMLVAWILAPLRALLSQKLAERRPNAVIFLDASPRVALARVHARGASCDAHENETDLAQARAAYLSVLEELAATGVRVLRIDTDPLAADDVTTLAIDAVSGWWGRKNASTPAGVVSTSDQCGLASIPRRLFNARYLRHLVVNLARGAWREPLFVLSSAGRTLIREGYSATVMRQIYREEPGSWSERAFHGHPLHRSVRQRFTHVVTALAAELSSRPGTVTLLSAPVGSADDLVEALSGCEKRVDLFTVDLDEAAGTHVRSWARARQIAHAHRQLDLSGSEDAFAEQRFDVILFIGLSSWLPKPALVRHLRRCRHWLRHDGVLITDAFAPAFYASGGRASGFHASYYRPDAYALLLRRAGFVLEHDWPDSHGLNTVFVARRAGTC